MEISRISGKYCALLSSIELLKDNNNNDDDNDEDHEDLEDHNEQTSPPGRV